MKFQFLQPSDTCSLLEAAVYLFSSNLSLYLSRPSILEAAAAFLFPSVLSLYLSGPSTVACSFAYLFPLY
jgi:hypothetical protein